MAPLAVPTVIALTVKARMKDNPINPPTVVIADDDAIVRFALERTLERECKVMASVGDGEAAVQAVDEHQPDIALLDISMPVLNGLDTAQRITETKPTVKVIIVTSHEDPAYIEEAFRRGARGYVLKGRIADLWRQFALSCRGKFTGPILAIDRIVQLPVRSWR